MRVSHSLFVSLLLILALLFGPARSVDPTPPAAQPGPAPKLPATPAASPQVADPAWLAVPPPAAGPANSYLQDVKMISPTLGWTVGYYGGSLVDYSFGSSRSLIERWDGQSWQVFPSPNDPISDSNQLAGVDFADPATGYAVGDGLLLRWDGLTWQRSYTPTLPGTALHDVRVLGANDVWAVGSYISGTQPNLLALHYDGMTWQPTVMPASLTYTDTRQAHLQAVAGSGPQDVWAVAQLYRRTTILHWDGQVWTETPVPLQFETYSKDIYDIISVNPQAAWAVGYSRDASNADSAALVLRWDGTSWTRQSTPTSEYYEDRLQAVTAISANEAWAVGWQYANGDRDRTPLHLHTSDGGTTWQPLRGEFNDLGDLLAVSAAGGALWAVGCGPYPDGGCNHTRIERWDGTAWQRSPNYPQVGEASVQINSAYVLDADHAWAVGMYSDARPLLYAWNNGSWQAYSTTLVPTTTFYARLDEVSASSPGNVWVIGTYEQRSADIPLIMRYDGSSWRIIPGPGYSGLSSIAAVGSNEVWAIGGDSCCGVRNVIWRYQNGTWTQTPFPALTPTLRSIRARTATDIWAVGSSFALTGTTLLTLHYTGTWQVVPTASGYDTFNGVAPLSANEAWAVAGDYNGYQAQAQRWDGATNRWIDASNGLTGVRELRSPAARASNDVWAISGYSNRDLRHWTGTTWLTSTLPAPVANYGYRVVAAQPGAPAWAFGSYEQAGALRPLIARYPAPAPGEFYDVPVDSLWYSYVAALAERGVVAGSGGYYQPNASTRRGEFAKIVTLAYALPAYNPPQPTFSDVQASHVFYPYIETANHAGAMSGYADGRFRPSQSITRGEAAVVIQRVRGYPAITPATPTFRDLPAGHFAYAAVETLASRGIIGGAACANGGLCFRPDDSIRRGELAKVVYNAVQQPLSLPNP